MLKKTMNCLVALVSCGLLLMLAGCKKPDLESVPKEVILTLHSQQISPSAAEVKYLLPVSMDTKGVLHDISVQADGSLVAVGRIFPEGVQGERGYAWLMDLQGTIIKEKPFYPDMDMALDSIISLADGSFITVARIKPPQEEAYHLKLLKLASNLEVIWEKDFGLSGNYNCAEVIETRDDGYAVTGNCDTGDGAGDDFYIVKFDKNGAILWERTFGTEYQDVSRAIVEARDGHLYVAGYGANTPSDIYVIGLDAKGKLKWQRHFGAEGHDRAHSIVLDNDQGVLVGGMVARESGEMDVTLARLSFQGELSWWRSYLFSDRLFAFAQAMRPLPGGGFVMAGPASHPNERTGIDSLIIRLDELGIHRNVYTFGGDDGEYTLALEPLDDGSLLLAGYNSRQVVQETEEGPQVMYAGSTPLLVKLQLF